MSSSPDSEVPLAVAVHGASGRMGRRLLDLLDAHPKLNAVAAWVPDESAALAQPANVDGSIHFAKIGTSQRKPDVVLDFSNAAGLARVLEWCRSHRTALLSGSTGLEEGDWTALEAAARQVPVLWAANFSLGVAVLNRAVALAARALPDWHAEIFEAHHAGKRDAPSGTALALGQAVAQARGQVLEQVAVQNRAARDRARVEEEIGFSVLRGGDIAGEHSLWLAGIGERLELTHRASDRSIFARGALHAAQWLAGQPAGLYRFEDSLT